MANELFEKLLARVNDKTLTITAGGGVIRGMSTALAKQIVNRHGIHIAFSEPTADEELNPQVRIGGNRLEGLYQLMLDACERKEAEAKEKGINLKTEPINLFLKLQPYHLTAEERGSFFELTGKRNVFSFRDPARTMESTIIGLLKISRDKYPDLNIEEIVEPGTDLSFIDYNSAKTPIAQLVEHIINIRDYSILGEGYLRYFSYYPVLNDPALKLDVWHHYAQDFPEETANEAARLGFNGFAELACAYATTPAEKFFSLPAILFEPLKFRRTGYTSMLELERIITADNFPAHCDFVVVESTLVQLRPEEFLAVLSDRLGLPKREHAPSLSYSQFDPGFKNNPAIRNALFARVNAFDQIQPPEAKLPVAPDKLPKCFYAELEREYETYMLYLSKPNRLRHASESLMTLFDTPLANGKTFFECYFTTAYALVSVDMAEPQRGVMKADLRKENPAYEMYFNLIDRGLALAKPNIVELQKRVAVTR